MALEQYRRKRNFRKTPEPGPEPGKAHRRPIFVVQEHHASHLHYDFRLEADGVLKSWAVPKQPSLDPAQKRLAVRVEDHPIAYARFTGTIPEGEYGAGTVTVWDHGTYDNLLADKSEPRSVTEGIASGRLEFTLHGRRLQGRFTLVRMQGRRHDGKDNWLLIKIKDDFARPDQGDPPAAKTKRAAPNKPARTTPRQAAAGAAAVTLTHPERVLYPDAGITKADVFHFYERVAPWLLPYLRDRPITLERWPAGIGGGTKGHFWQKDLPESYPDWIPRVELPTESGKTVHYGLVNDLNTLLYLVNQGTLTFHPWLSRVQDLDRPDFVLFDLDPGEATFADAVTVARQVHDALDAEGVESYVKTSGKTGLHVLVPWERAGGYGEARAWAEQVAGRVTQALPDVATTERSKAKRGRRVYVDVMQNARGHHVVPPYVLRAVPGAPVSMPLTWREVRPGLDPAKYNLATAVRALSRRRQDPMAGLLRSFERP